MHPAGEQRARFSVQALLQIEKQRRILEQRKAWNTSQNSSRAGLRVELIVDYLLEELDDLEPEIVAKAGTGSVYIKFYNPRIGKLRIGDHKERKQYAYRWQLRVDKKGKCVKQNKGHRQFFYGADLVDELVRHILNYAAKCPEP